MAVDMSVELSSFVFKLQQYNTALLARNKYGGVSGGTDYGGPVREEVIIFY